MEVPKREEIINSAKRIMGNSCVICKKYDCDYSKSEEKRITWVENTTCIQSDEHFDCFVEK